MDGLKALFAMVVVGALPGVMIWAVSWFAFRRNCRARVAISVLIFVLVTIWLWPTSIMIAPFALPGFAIVIAVMEWAVRADAV